MWIWNIITQTENVKYWLYLMAWSFNNSSDMDSVWWFFKNL